MPLCYGFTNLSSSEIPADFEKRLTSCLAEMLTRPVERIAVIVNCNARISKGGSSDHAFMLQIHAVGVFDEQRNPGYFTKLFDFLTSSLKMPAKRMNIQLIDVALHTAKGGQ